MASPSLPGVIAVTTAALVVALSCGLIRLLGEVGAVVAPAVGPNGPAVSVGPAPAPGTPITSAARGSGSLGSAR